ncbi:hypothetical protein NA56DRAFT_11872 [Hyaloscypha hepaticicola]|uniref:Uncharacterized protein n=1 Tax=Hyaloscypha hepaticicola TaxID=2082293 RepID=A0A2J6QQ37_9HELO|nr:hypothetical protein NA56DRAFT_11872 [Hyaloscypha hepaticicola]
MRTSTRVESHFKSPFWPGPDGARQISVHDPVPRPGANANANPLDPAPCHHRKCAEEKRERGHEERERKDTAKIFQALKPSHKAQPFSSLVLTSYFTITNPPPSLQLASSHPPSYLFPPTRPSCALKSRTASTTGWLACLLVQPVAPSPGNSAIPDQAVDPQLLHSWPRSLTSAPPKFCDSFPNVVERNSTPRYPRHQTSQDNTYTQRARNANCRQISARCVRVPACLSRSAPSWGTNEGLVARHNSLPYPQPSTTYLLLARPPRPRCSKPLELCLLSSSAAFFVNELSPYHSLSVTYFDTLPW